METVKVVEFTAVIEEIELPFKLYDTVLAISLSKLAVNVMLSPGPIRVSSPERERESVIVKIGEQGRFHLGIKFGLAFIGEASLKFSLRGLLGTHQHDISWSNDDAPLNITSNLATEVTSQLPMG